MESEDAVAVAAAPPTPQRPPIADRASRPLAGLLVLLIAAVIAVGTITTVVMGPDSYLSLSRDYPGLPTGVATTVARAIADLSSLLTLGGLCVSLFLGRGAWTRVSGGRRLETAEWFENLVVRRASLCWLVSSICLVMLEAADSNGLTVGVLRDPEALWFALFSGDFARAWMLASLAAAFCVCVSHCTVGWVTHLIAMWVGTIGALAPVVVGQVLVGPNHDFAGDAAFYQTLALHLGLGALVVLTLRLVSGREIPGPGRRRWFGPLLLAWAVTLAAEILILWFKLAGSAPWDSPTGWFALPRLIGFALIPLGLWLARPGRDRESFGRTRRAMVVATLGVAVVIATGVAMTRIPPPQYFVDTSVSQIFLGFDLPQAPSFTVLVTHWRPNILFLAAALVATGTYLAGVIRLRRRTDHWPVTRTCSWMVGWLILVVATSSGFGTYSGADFAVHMGVHMTLNMAAPLFLVLGGPVTLALRAFPAAGRPDAPGPREWISAVLASRFLHSVYHPLLVFGLYIGSYYGLYLTEAFGTLMRFHWAHQLMNLHFVIVGCLYFGLVIGVDPTPRKLPHIGKLGFIMAAMPFHAFFGVILMSSTSIIGENFYVHLAQPWADLERSQSIGGGIAWAGGEIPLLIVVIVLAIQWAIQDGKDARRIDRRLDARADNEHAAYNAMLTRIHGNQAPRPRAGVKDSPR